MKLEIQDLRVFFGGFDLRIDAELQGRMTAVFGPSGAGKTTLLECITGLRRPGSGRIVLDGQVLFDSADRTWVPPYQRKIGYVPQDLALFPSHDRGGKSPLRDCRRRESLGRRQTIGDIPHSRSKTAHPVRWRAAPRGLCARDPDQPFAAHSRRAAFESG